MRWVTLSRCALALPLILLSFAAQAGNSSQYTFDVFMDGKQIGHHRVAVNEDAGRIEVKAATNLVVRAAFIPVFRFEHQRREIWENGQPVLISARTNDDGKKLNITVRPEKHGYVRIVNGRIDRFDDSVKVMTLWNRDIVNHTRFVSVILDKIIDVTFQYLGRERLILDGRAVVADHYRMDGDDHRDIWYDEGGQVLKVEFVRGGSEIQYVRTNAAPFKDGTKASIERAEISEFPQETN
jgi:hypothetical protein